MSAEMDSTQWHNGRLLDKFSMKCSEEDGMSWNNVGGLSQYLGGGPLRNLSPKTGLKICGLCHEKIACTAARNTPTKPYLFFLFALKREVRAEPCCEFKAIGTISAYFISSLLFPWFGCVGTLQRLSNTP